MHNYFVYGSLLNRVSASFILGVPPDKVIYSPVILHDWAIAFDVAEDVRVQGELISVAFLNICKSKGKGLYGQTLALTNQQLEALKKRERKYDIIEVQVYDFSSKKTLLALTACSSERNCNLPILQQYIRKVRDGAQGFEGFFSLQYLPLLQESIQEKNILLGDYQFVSDEQNKLSGIEK